jgi:hypothetical protein
MDNIQPHPENMRPIEPKLLPVNLGYDKTKKDIISFNETFKRTVLQEKRAREGILKLY